jgi:hypothetical protein
VAKEKLTYEEAKPIAREDAIRRLHSHDLQAAESAILSVALFEPELEFASRLVFEGAHRAEPRLRGTALLCIGHLARLHRRLPEEPTVELVRAGLHHPDAYVRGQAQNALDDLLVFIPALGRIVQQE